MDTKLHDLKPEKVSKFTDEEIAVNVEKAS
jgi:hypothetical protein